MFTTDPDLLEEIRKRATDECVFRAMGIFEAITGDDGQMYGDVPLRGPELRAAVIDLAGRGILQYLQFIDDAVGSRHTDRLLREFDRAY